MLDTLAQIVRVHRVKLPTSLAKIFHEPLVAWVLALVARGEAREPGAIFPPEGDALQAHVLAAIAREPLGQIPFRHVQATWIVVADIKQDQIATVVVFSEVVDLCAATETTHRQKPTAYSLSTGASTPRTVPFSDITRTR